MIDTATAIEAYLAAGGVLQTRLRERSMGEVHDLPTYSPVMPGVSLCPEDVVAILEQCERAGTVRRCYAVVHPYDSSEYRIIWAISRDRTYARTILREGFLSC